MAETSSSSGRKRAQVDGPLASSSASSSKFDGAARFKSFLKMQKSHLRDSNFQNFSGGACSRTPLGDCLPSAGSSPPSAGYCAQPHSFSKQKVGRSTDNRHFRSRVWVEISYV